MSGDHVAGTPGGQHLCERCGGETRAATVKSAFWERERLVVIEDIPARVCDTCLERYYDEQTIAELDLLRGAGLAEDEAGAFLRVPVFSLKSGRPPEAPADR